MKTSPEELEEWKTNALKEGASHLVIAEDDETGEEYPYMCPYQQTIQHIKEALASEGGQTVIEVIELKAPAPIKYPEMLTFPEKPEPNGIPGRVAFPNSEFPRNGAEAVFLRRKAQLEKKGYTYEVDKKSFGSNPLTLLRAANAYTAAASLIIMQAPIARPEVLVTHSAARELGWPFDEGFWKPYSGELSEVIDVIEMVQTCIEKSAALQVAALDLFVDYDSAAQEKAWELHKTHPEFPGCADCGRENH